MPVPIAPVQIALLDDHPLFRQGLRYILQTLPYVEAVTEAAELSELLVSCRQRIPDILLLDLQMPNTDGMEVAQVLLAEFPQLKIIVLSMFSADKFVTQMIKLGARSYLPKDATQEELILAIEDVLATGHHFTPHISRALMRNVQRPTRQPATELFNLIRLTSREREVLRYICEGYTAAKIADQLSISPRTVEGHWQKLLEKTGATNVAGLVLFATKHGMVET
ncbi:two component transcriptional regulator, LuxR family [Hymenobacter daecheongensis DSM 21074]|uniref:Two component transcriptional regulator, LuxR family n=1 Tax=Hymenobacter daecheongensis DSM 21074 TaxID=1121955 RepID=A0A1M6I2F2_9BACT|nr:response regulator transcription factor [Hymenobacter daecheongensis]SHJ28636.1 two component transcriptional regulator, LuxR family [Hymenobacter daecheongensis DSM 21074]